TNGVLAEVEEVVLGFHGPLRRNQILSTDADVPAAAGLIDRDSAIRVVRIHPRRAGLAIDHPAVPGQDIAQPGVQRVVPVVIALEAGGRAVGIGKGYFFLEADQPRRRNLPIVTGLQAASEATWIGRSEGVNALAGGHAADMRADVEAGPRRDNHERR